MAKLALIGAVLVTLLVCLSRIAYPHDLSLYEANRWAPANAIADGQSPYYKSAATTPPYVVAPYGPLYYGFIAVGAKLFGDQFVFGRALGLAALMAGALFIYLILRRYAVRTSTFIPLVGAGLFVAQYPAQVIGAVLGPDLVALALALGGLVLVFLREPTRADNQVGRAALAGFLLADAVMVRQTLILPLFVAFAWYALHREGRAMLAFSLVAGATGAGAFAFLQSTSDGGFWWHAVQLQSSFSWSLSNTLELARTYLASPATIFALVLLVIGMLRSTRRSAQVGRTESEADARLLRRLLFVYLLAAVALAAVTSAKEGANINYWLEVSAVLSLLTALYLDPLEVRATLTFGPTRPLWLSDSLCLVVITLTFGAALITGARQARGQQLQWEALPYVNEVVAKIRRLTAPGEFVYVEFPDLAVSAGRPYLFNDVVLYQASPLVSETYHRVLRSKRLRVLASLAPEPPPGYAPVCMSHAAAAGVHNVRLYYRVNRRPASRQDCVLV